MTGTTAPVGSARWDAGAKRERIALAKRALDISELCADAHVLLAEEAAKTLVEARRH